MSARVLSSLEQVALEQYSVVSRAQLLARGISDRLMSARVARGEWQRPAAAVYCLDQAPLSSEQRRIAAALYLGEACQITGPSALHYYGFRYALSTDKVHALVPHEMRRRSTGVIAVMRTEALDPRPRDGGLYRVVSPGRAVVDAARVTSDVRAVRAIFAEAVQAGHADVKALHDELARAKRSRTAIGNRILKEIVDGVRSLPEAELRALVESSSVLPRVLWNPTLVNEDGIQLPTPDGYLADAAIALEVDSREFHLDTAGYQRTMSRGNTLSRYGIIVLHFTPAEIRTSPARVLRTIELTFRERLVKPPNVRVRVIEGEQ
jgi:hypothetical protein